MPKTRWVRPVSEPAAPADRPPPVLPSLEVEYRTDPDLVAEVVPPPLEPVDDAHVHVRVTDIDIPVTEDFHWRERVGYVAVDAAHDGRTGEYPLLIPIDLESAVAISRERFGEPKKLADIDLVRDGAHVEGRMTRDGVTFAEIVGDVTGELPVPAPVETCQWWFKFLPGVNGHGFDAGPLLVRVDQRRETRSVEGIDGKLVLRDLASAPVVDLPVVDTVAIRWTVRSSSHVPTVVGPVDADAFEPYAAARYDHF